ncbi:uncharacterized protein METZ01_LOCUS201286, partial [marine metagenome]
VVETVGKYLLLQQHHLLGLHKLSSQIKIEESA